MSLDSVIHSDGWRGYNGLVDVGYSKHFRVNHSDDVFAIGDIHINGSKVSGRMLKDRFCIAVWQQIVFIAKNGTANVAVPPLF